jgi:hypothetical protein
MIRNTIAYCCIDSSEKQTLLAILDDNEIILYWLGSEKIATVDCAEILNCARILSRWHVGKVQSETQQAIAISYLTKSNHIEIFVAYTNNGDLQCRMFCYDSNLLEKEIYCRIIFLFKIKNYVLRNVCNVSFFNGSQILFVMNGDNLMLSDPIASDNEKNEMTNRRDNSDNENAKIHSDNRDKNSNEAKDIGNSCIDIRKEVQVYCHKLPPLLSFNKSYNLLQPDSTVIRDILIINENDGDIAMIIKSKLLPVYRCLSIYMTTCLEIILNLHSSNCFSR